MQEEQLKSLRVQLHQLAEAAINLPEWTFDGRVDLLSFKYGNYYLCQVIERSLQYVQSDFDLSFSLRVLSVLKGSRARVITRDIVKGLYAACPSDHPEALRAFALRSNQQDAHALLPTLLQTSRAKIDGLEYLIWAAGVHKVDKAVDLLREYLSQDNYIAKFAALALGRIGEPSDVITLMRIAADATPYDSKESIVAFAVAGIGFSHKTTSKELLLALLQKELPFANVADRALRMVTAFDAGWSEKEGRQWHLAAIDRWYKHFNNKEDPSIDFSAEPAEVDNRIWILQNFTGRGLIRIETEIGGPEKWLQWYKFLWIGKNKIFQVGSICGTCRYWLRLAGVPSNSTSYVHKKIMNALAPSKHLSWELFDVLRPILRLLRPGRQLCTSFTLQLTQPNADNGVFYTIGAHATVWPLDEPHIPYLSGGVYPLGIDIPGYPKGRTCVVIVPLQPESYLNQNQVNAYQEDDSQEQPRVIALGQLDLHLPVVFTEDLPPPEALLRLYVLDGHHRVQAAARSGKSCEILVILPIDAVSTPAVTDFEGFAGKILHSILANTVV